MLAMVLIAALATLKEYEDLPYAHLPDKGNCFTVGYPSRYGALPEHNFLIWDKIMS